MKSGRAYSNELEFNHSANQFGSDIRLISIYGFKLFIIHNSAPSRSTVDHTIEALQIECLIDAVYIKRLPIDVNFNWPTTERPQNLANL